MHADHSNTWWLSTKKGPMGGTPYPYLGEWADIQAINIVYYHTHNHVRVHVRVGLDLWPLRTSGLLKGCWRSMMELIWMAFRSPSSLPRRGGVEGEEGGALIGGVVGSREVSPCCMWVQILYSGTITNFFFYVTHNYRALAQYNIIRTLTASMYKTFEYMTLCVPHKRKVNKVVWPYPYWLPRPSIISICTVIPWCI